jgi:hypothetical protein
VRSYLTANQVLATSEDVVRPPRHLAQAPALLSVAQDQGHVQHDEDITSTSTPAAPSLQAPPSGPITRARARELNYVMVLKNEGYVAGFGLRTNVNL